MARKATFAARNQNERDTKQAKADAKGELEQLRPALDDITQNWSGLNDKQQIRALRRGLIIALRTIKWIVKRQARHTSGRR